MSDTVIRAEHLGKTYVIGHQAEKVRYVALRDVLAKSARTFWNKTKDLVQGKAIIQGDKIEEIWALKDVSFEIPRGDAVGIIGRNGAGKSTLLKILSRITEPTAGRVTIKGRVASLLEVGTGFHPEMTGRENIILNGAILGMTRAEVRRKFDEIVAFAEIENFLDTPVKRYSSGMYVRLAFAVAAHLEPEILLVDEVLAVGDAAFQKKCLGKMGDVAKEGRTVLFVSHNMGAILNLCSTTILLSDGQIMGVGESADIVREYLASSGSFESLKERFDRNGTGTVRIVNCEIYGDRKCAPTTDLMLGDESNIVLTLWARRPIEVFVGITLSDDLGRLIFAFASREGGFAPTLPMGESIISLRIPRLPLLPGKYVMRTQIVDADTHVCYDDIDNAAFLTIHGVDLAGSGNAFSSKHGVMFIPHEWTSSSGDRRLISWRSEP